MNALATKIRELLDPANGPITQEAEGLLRQALQVVEEGAEPTIINGHLLFKVPEPGGAS